MLKNYIYWIILFFCLLANLISLITLDKNYTYARDAFVVVALVVAAFRVEPTRAPFVSLISASILLMCFIKGFPPEVFSKVRNYVSFPFICLIASSLYSSKTFDVSRGYEKHSDKEMLTTIFYIVCIGTFVEALFYVFVPNAQFLAWSQLRDLSEEKGVSVGLGGGLINGSRMMTPLLSPVQGSFVAFLTLSLLPASKNRSLLYYALHALTFSKVTIFSDMLRRSIEHFRFQQILLSAIGAAALVVLFMWIATPEALETNIASADMHFRGAYGGLITPFSSPWGLPLDQVGALEINEDTLVRPGFESFIGSYVASFGIFGLAAVILTLFISKKSSHNGMLIVLLIMWTLSDNISSPHLYLPVIISALIMSSNYK